MASKTVIRPIFISLFLLGGILIEENRWPIEVLVEIFKWFSIEERLKQLAPVCKLFHQAVHTPKFWKIVDTNSEFILSSFHSVFGHAKRITHLGFRYSQRKGAEI